MQTYIQLVGTEARAWAGDHPTLDEAFTAVCECAEHDGDGIALCSRQGKSGDLITEGPDLLRPARQPMTVSASARG